MVEIVGHSQTKERANGEPEHRPKPARQASTLLSGGRRRALQWAPPPTRYRLDLKHCGRGQLYEAETPLPYEAIAIPAVVLLNAIMGYT